MPRKDIQIVKHQRDLIKRMMYDEHLYDRQIIQRLREQGIDLAESTFYENKRAIQQQESEIWDKIAVDSVKYRAVRLIRSLEEGIRLNENIRDDKNNTVKERQDASKLVTIYEASIYKLVSKTSDFKQIPLIKTSVNHVNIDTNTVVKIKPDIEDNNNNTNNNNNNTNNSIITSDIHN